MFCGGGSGRKKWQKQQNGIRFDEFQNCFEQWKKCLNRCIASNREDFDSD